MRILIQPQHLSGTIGAITSKSMAHRMLILAALSEDLTDFDPLQASQDIIATRRCLEGLGASFGANRSRLTVVPLAKMGARSNARLDAGESGSTLRFLLPIVAALGRGARISCHGRLADRPLSPLDNQLEQHGAHIVWTDRATISVSGKLLPGRFFLPGNISSQFVSGLLMAAPLLGGTTEVVVSEPVESAGYIDLTIGALARFGVTVGVERTTRAGEAARVYTVASGERLRSPKRLHVEGDWSNAAFWLAAGAMGAHAISVDGLDLQSRQADKSILGALALFGAHISRTADSAQASPDTLHAITIDVSGMPDLVPPLAAVASVSSGITRLTKAGRLRLKESDRLESVSAALRALGGKAHVDGDDLVIEGVDQLRGSEVDACNDHRIAMMAAICASVANGDTVIRGAECVAKSYPTFFDDFRSLGGRATEQEDSHGI